MITDYAQSSLGDVVFVELSEQGSSVGQGGMWLLFPFYISFPLHGWWLFDRVSAICLRCLYDVHSLYTDNIGAVESVKAASDIVRSHLRCLFSYSRANRL